MQTWDTKREDDNKDDHPRYEDEAAGGKTKKNSTLSE